MLFSLTQLNTRLISTQGGPPTGEDLGEGLARNARQVLPRVSPGSNAAQNGREGDTEDGGDLPEGFDGDSFGAALHLTDVNGVKIRLFGQGFLAQPGFPAEVPDVRADAPADCLD